MDPHLRLTPASVGQDGVVEDVDHALFLIETVTGSRYQLDMPRERFCRMPATDGYELVIDGEWMPLRNHTTIRIDHRLTLSMGGSDLLTTSHVIRVFRAVGSDSAGLGDDRA